MAGTHFKGPLLFSSARASLENLKQSMWPDQFTYMDDFYEGAVDTTLKWTIVKDSGASAAIVADATGGEIALTSTATTENDGASIQGNMRSFLYLQQQVIAFGLKQELKHLMQIKWMFLLD